MAATVEFRVRYGADPGTEESTDASDLNLLGADLGSGETASLYPIRIPGPGGTSYSYERVFKMKVTDMGGATYLNNFRVWADSNTPSTGCELYYAIKESYTSPVNDNSGIAENGGSLIPTSDPGYASPNVTIGGSTTGTLASAGDSTDYIYLQLKVDDTATSGATNNIHVAWDEVV